MRRLLYFTVFLFIMATLLSCQKNSIDSPKEIILGVKGEDNFQVSTKASAVTSMPGALYWGVCYTNESIKYGSAYSSVYSNQIYTGLYQTASSTAYNWYAANADFTPGGNMTVSNNGTDIVAGRAANTSSSTPGITLNHIFARTGSLSLGVPSGYSVSGVSWYIIGSGSVHGTAGTFYMPSLSWTSSSAPLNSWTAFDSYSDLYLIPGSYTILVAFTLTRGEFSRYYEQTGGVTLYQGYINNIHATTYSSDAVEVTFSTSVASWGTNSSSFDWSNL